MNGCQIRLIGLQELYNNLQFPLNADAAHLTVQKIWHHFHFVDCGCIYLCQVGYVISRSRWFFTFM